MSAGNVCWGMDKRDMRGAPLLVLNVCKRSHGGLVGVAVYFS